MQFVKGGPDIPDALIDAHEEGRVVFFCGAGISYPAGLPSFKGLVNQIYELVSTDLDEAEREAYDAKKFDATLDLLERRLPGQRLEMRRALQEALRPKTRRKNASRTHEALLRLSRRHGRPLRLVTTNFDRLFHLAGKRSSQSFETYAAPMLPIPKNSRWDGLVFLHGLLPVGKGRPEELNRLVVSSGDFGLAYLTERWASRFVSDLFKEYVVCFIGYSIDDPVLRYMMDALAADRMLGENTVQAWAFGHSERGQEARRTVEWKSKGVDPILYHGDNGRHEALHDTIHAWSETYRDGVQGKESIVRRYALSRPQNSTHQDNFVGRMLWAISDRSGLPAKVFADHDPAPSLDWLLDTFTDGRFAQSDLPRFGVKPIEGADDPFRFSLVDRPPPYGLAPRMRLVPSPISWVKWDDVMHHLARWATRHLNDPRLLLWVSRNGGLVHEEWSELIEDALRVNDISGHRGARSEQDQMNADDATINREIRILWKIILSGKLKVVSPFPGLARWVSRLKTEGISTTLRLELRELLAPKILLVGIRRRSGSEEESADPNKAQRLVNWDLELASDDVQWALRNLKEDFWIEALPHLLEDLQVLLLDALDLLRELEAASDHQDRSFLQLPSVLPHRQNRGRRSWVSLIELVRDAWVEVFNKNRTKGIEIAQGWFDRPYPTFKRLALFAACQDRGVPPGAWLAWLLAEDGHWLWSVETRREVLRLLVMQGHKLADAEREMLEAKILVGPSRSGYKSMSEGEWAGLRDRAVWLRLAKLNISPRGLGDLASRQLAELSRFYPTWRLAQDESDEFAIWMSARNDPYFEERRIIERAPRVRSELVQWLRKPVRDRALLFDDTWGEVARTRFSRALYALCDLSWECEWPTERWRTALDVWSGEGMAEVSWSYAAPLVAKMPDPVLCDLVETVALWMSKGVKGSNRHEDGVLLISRRIMDAPFASTDARLGCSVEEAISHPLGQVAQALIARLMGREQHDRQGLPDGIRELLSDMCEDGVEVYRHGRVLLGASVIQLFRIDSEWTRKSLLPFFSWDRTAEASALWQGFLWSSRLDGSLMDVLKLDFLKAAGRYDCLGQFGEQYAMLLTYSAIDLPGSFSLRELREPMSVLPEEGLVYVLEALLQALESSGEKREEFWKNRVLPFWKEAWPKSNQLVGPRISAPLVEIIISTGSEFPSALRALSDWILPAERLEGIVSRIEMSEVCERFPADALFLLDKIVGEDGWPASMLSQCIDRIVQADQGLAGDPRVRRLQEFLRRRTH